jgi:hypothetical protein
VVEQKDVTDRTLQMPCLQVTCESQARTVAMGAPLRLHWGQLLALRNAVNLAICLGLLYLDALVKVTHNQPQKRQQNRFRQCRNLDGAFRTLPTMPDGPVLLVVDTVDSGWTLTAIAALLRQADSGDVYPVALASSSVNNT